METKILFATTNPHKKERFQSYFTSLGLKVVDYGDLGISPDVEEDGKTAEENALKKATTGHAITGLPTFGVDYWFNIHGLPEEKQPGPYVRRIFVGGDGGRVEATDEQMLDYYSEQVEKLGGKTAGNWISAIALVAGEEQQFTKRFERETVLVSKISPKRTKGEPLNSLQIDPKTEKYFTDLTKDEWLNLQKKREEGYVEFMKEHLEEI